MYSLWSPEGIWTKMATEFSEVRENYNRHVSWHCSGTYVTIHRAVVEGWVVYILTIKYIGIAVTRHWL